MSPVYDDDLQDSLDDEAPQGEPRVRVPEFVRKMAVAGLGAFFMTEEGIRNLAGQLKLPKEALGHLLAQAEKTKDEVGRIASEEIRRFLQSDTLREEFLKLLSGMTVEIKAEVRLVPPKEGASPDAATRRVVVSDLKARPERRSGKKE
ncbi:MAG: hypothetical protein L0Y66_23045 [Myxococcaceae bacterium]|nr:hypothetical protein [Myxococcaceae bacterium]